MFGILSGSRKMSFIQGREIRNVAPNRQKWMLSSLLAISLSAMATSADAAPKAMSKAPPPAPKFATTLEGTTGLPASAYPFMSEPQFQELMKKARKGERRIASNGYDFEGSLSPQFKNFRERFLQVTQASEIDPLLAKLEAEFDTYPADLKLVASQIIPLREWRGFVYRFRPLAEKARVVHSMLLTTVQDMASNMRIYIPTRQAEALFAYMTQPYDGVTQFKEAEDLQQWAVQRVYPAMVKATDRVRALDLSRPVVWDNKVFYGIGSFPDNLDRYSLVGEPERRALLAASHQGMAFTTAFRAYSVKGLFDLSVRLGKLYGFDGFLGGQVEGAPMEDRVAQFRRYPNLFLLYADGADWTQLSWRHVRESVYWTAAAWEEIKDKPESELSALNPIFFQTFRRGIGNQINDWKALVAGPTTLRSRVTNETVTVHLEQLYRNPPADMKSLMPTAFEGGPRSTSMQIKQRDSRGREVAQAVEYRNYFRGRATDWNLSAYKPWMTSLSSGAEVGRAQRILSQSWGGSLMAMPLTNFVE